MPPPRPATEVHSGSLEPGRLSQARSASMRQSSWTAVHAGRRPDVRDRRQTDRQTSDNRQHRHLIPPGRGNNNAVIHSKDAQSTCRDLQTADTGSDQI